MNSINPDGTREKKRYRQQIKKALKQFPTESLIYCDSAVLKARFFVDDNVLASIIEEILKERGLW